MKCWFQIYDFNLSNNFFQTQVGSDVSDMDVIQYRQWENFHFYFSLSPSIPHGQYVLVVIGCAVFFRLSPCFRLVVLSIAWWLLRALLISEYLRLESTAALWQAFRSTMLCSVRVNPAGRRHWVVPHRDPDTVQRPPTGRRWFNVSRDASLSRHGNLGRWSTVGHQGRGRCGLHSSVRLLKHKKWR